MTDTLDRIEARAKEALDTGTPDEADAWQRKAQAAEAALADTRRALDTILQWDCLNPPRRDLLADLPWLKTQLENARALAAATGDTGQEQQP